jgi:hypothetical protein
MNTERDRKGTKPEIRKKTKRKVENTGRKGGSKKRLERGGQ